MAGLSNLLMVVPLTAWSFGIAALMQETSIYGGDVAVADFVVVFLLHPLRALVALVIVVSSLHCTRYCIS